MPLNQYLGTSRQETLPMEEIAERVKKNAKTIRPAFAKVVGVSEKEINQENIRGASQILKPMAMVAAKGGNPDDVPISELKKDSGGGSSPDDDGEIGNTQRLIARAIIGLAPALAGAAIGGSSGGVAGARAGLGGLDQLDKGEAAEKEAKRDRKLLGFKEDENKRDEEVLGLKKKELALSEKKLKQELQIAQIEAKKKSDFASSEHIAKLQDKFNKDNIADQQLKVLAAARSAKLLVLEGGPVATEAVKAVFPRLAGEVGNLAQAEQKRFQGSPAIINSLNRWQERLVSGTLTQQDKKDLLTIADVFEKNAKNTLSQRADIVAIQGNRSYGIDETKIKDSLGYDIAIGKTPEVAQAEAKFISSLPVGERAQFEGIFGISRMPANIPPQAQGSGVPGVQSSQAQQPELTPQQRQQMIQGIKEKQMQKMQGR